MPVVLEGYPPPTDHRLNQFKVTPDPGVIEVNIHPAAVVGRAGGADHHALRGSAQDPPGDRKIHGRRPPYGHRRREPRGPRRRRRRPTARSSADPTCSGAWSRTGTIIPRCRICSRGCSSGRRARRRGSTRHGTTACTSWKSPSARSPSTAAAPPGWWTASSGNLLVDVTGSTHRAEFCIDKLYSPDSERQPPGPARDAGFEMPPHPQMSLVQQLLIRAPGRAVLADPYDPRLVRWGTELHDRFMLPHFVAQDFHDVIDELRKAGLPLEHEWFDPHFEFRFPLFRTGRPIAASMVELRQAIEPWHVLGEEASATGASRYVDSSVERVQVKVQGMTDDRHRGELQRPPRSAASDREPTASTSPGFAIAPGSPPPACTRISRCTLRWSLTSSIPGWNVRWGASPIMFPIPAAVPTTRFRSTPTRRRAAVSPGSSRSDTPRARCLAPERRSPEAR